MSLTAISCRVRNSCEVNHLGTIAVINRTASTVELRVNSEKIGEIDNQIKESLNNAIMRFDVLKQENKLTIKYFHTNFLTH